MENQIEKYGLYARKSSESEERQVQSIDDQISAMNILANRLGINVVEVYKESKSAKQPYNRPVYAQMVQDIKAGKINAILCWQLNRLSRNPIESGELNWLLQTGTIKTIQTNDKEYRSDDNVLLFNIESGIANQFIIDLKKSSMRGMEGKATRGWLPSRAPVGYLNDKLEHTIIPDDQRWNLVRNMWDMALTGKYSQQAILDIANNEWGFITHKSGRYGGKGLSRSSLYSMFENVFYTGNFIWKGKLYSGNHKPMVTIEEFEQVQKIFKKNDRPRPSKLEQAYTGLMRCPCGCRITAETKIKKLITTGKKKGYTFYRCTKRKKGVHCDSRPINLGDLEKQILEELDKYAINQRFLDWAFEVIDENASQDIKDIEKVSEMKKVSIEEKEKDLKNLRYMRMKEFIDDDQFLEDKTRLENEIKMLGEKQAETVKKAEKRESLKNSLKFISEAKKRLKGKDNEVKRDVLSYFGDDHVLDDTNFQLNPCDWMIPVRTSYKNLEERYERLEPEKTLVKQGQSSEIDAIRTDWGAYRDSNPG